MQTLMQGVQVGLDALRDGDLTRAESVFDQLLGQITEPDVNVLMGYGTTLVSQGRYGIGATLLSTALQLRPDVYQLWTNYGCALKFLGKDDQALAAYERSLELKPGEAETLAAIAGFWINKDAAAKVEDYARQALAADPEFPAAHMHLALGLLEQGRFEEAWPHYEYRWDTIERLKDRRPYKAPKWTGERVGTLAIHGEQGLGDEIFFMSALREAQKRADRVVVECAPRLVDLFEHAFGVNCYRDHGELIHAEGEPDAYIPMGSLFGVVGMPDGHPYMPCRWPKANTRPLIGIAWEGGTTRTNRDDRTMSLDDFYPILNTPGMDFVSVQYGPDSVDELAQLHGLELMAGRDIETIHQTIGDCDLIITVPQTAVHQAGAMGVPCWVLTPKRAAWRYCGESMPWYRSVELFHQTGDWSEVVDTVAGRLQERFAKAA